MYRSTSRPVVHSAVDSPKGDLIRFIWVGLVDVPYPSPYRFETGEVHGVGESTPTAMVGDESHDMLDFGKPRSTEPRRICGLQHGLLSIMRGGDMNQA